MKSTRNALIFSALMLTCCWQTAFAQCEQPAENCYETVCIFGKTELEGILWNTAGFSPDPLPVGGFCSQIQNDQWIAFQADSNRVFLNITTSNCQNGNGIQVAVYRTCETAPLACNGGCAGCGAQVTSLAFDADSGAVYYLLIDGFSGDICDLSFSATGISDNPNSLDVGLVEGRVLFDANQDCLPDAGDLPAGGVKLNFDANQRRTKPSKPDGSFKFYYFDPGGVSVSIGEIPGHYWQPCQPVYNIVPDSFPDTTQVNLLLFPTVSCAYMTVDLGMPPLLRPCMPTRATVHYCNTGTIAAENAFIEVTVPQGIVVDSSSWPIAAQYGDTLRFDVGTVQPFQCGDFFIYIKPECDGDLIGQTKCLSAHIYPDTLCPTWTGAHIELSTRCVGDSTVRFKVANTGSAPTSNLEYIIIEDIVVLHKGFLQLAPGDSMIIQKPAKGSTWRLEVEQESGHPGRSKPAAAIEGCDGLASLGFINAFAQDDADDFVDIDCQVIVGSYDPNLKAASPSGAGPQRLIGQNVPIEYVIHFQNTGTDTAFLVKLLDTLPVNVLDIKTFRPGASSHPCTWQIMDGRVLEVLFVPIVLPDSNVNERASHGWFEYRIDQKNGLPNGSYIENKAAIYFDYNDPVITDPAWHRVGKLSVSIFEPRTSEPHLWRVMGNPAQHTCLFEAQHPVSGTSRFELADAQGRVLRTAEFSGQQFTFERGTLPAGLYFFKIHTQRDGVTAGKIMLHD
jgi:uncharacterized repeat protein (TIGR01451 family)